jgi:hypothetical protein
MLFCHRRFAALLFPGFKARGKKLFQKIEIQFQFQDTPWLGERTPTKAVLLEKKLGYSLIDKILA